MLGEQMSNLDVTAFGLLAQFALADLDCEYNRAVKTYPNLLDYCERMQWVYFVN